MSLTILIFSLASLHSVSVDSLFLREAVGARSYPPPPRLAERAKLVPAAELPPAKRAEPERLAAMQEWNERGAEPPQIGLVRRLADPLLVRVGAGLLAKESPAPSGSGMLAASPRGTVVWSTAIRVADAARLRLRLTNVRFPAEAVLWVYGSADEPQGFGRELIDEQGSLWTPSTTGDTVWLELEMPAGGDASFVIPEVGELFARLPGAKPTDDPSCLVDASCTASTTFSSISIARKATAHIEMPQGGGTFIICSGGLLNDRAGDGTPYFLTANHCMSTQSTATSAEFFFDYQTFSCNGNASFSNSKRVSGAQLLATSSQSDFTFLRLNSIPAGRAFLGWTTETLPSGTRIYRVSHPAPGGTLYPQMYSSAFVNASAGTCTVLPRPRFLYSSSVEGGTYGGSSGSPVMLDNGRVVGQLYGGCGANPGDGCDSRVSAVDGAFAVTYASIEQWLSPSTAPPPSCLENSTQICLANNRFAVRVNFNDGQAKTATAIKYTADSGLFWFFDKANIEVIVKMIDACGFNQRFWVYSGGTTDLAVTITVTDTKTGQVKTYDNPRGKPFVTITDGGAFATCP